MLRISVSEQDPSCRIIKLEGKLLQAWVDEVRRLCVETEEGSLPSLDLSGLSFVDRPGAEMLQSFCGKVFAFTPALRSWRSCCIGTANQTLKPMVELTITVGLHVHSGDAELFHSAAERVGMKGEDLAAPWGHQ